VKGTLAALCFFPLPSAQKPPSPSLPDGAGPASYFRPNFFFPPNFFSPPFSLRLYAVFELGLSIMCNTFSAGLSPLHTIKGRQALFSSIARERKFFPVAALFFDCFLPLVRCSSFQWRNHLCDFHDVFFFPHPSPAPVGLPAFLETTAVDSALMRDYDLPLAAYSDFLVSCDCPPPLSPRGYPSSGSFFPPPGTNSDPESYRVLSWNVDFVRRSSPCSPWKRIVHSGSVELPRCRPVYSLPRLLTPLFSNISCSSLPLPFALFFRF